MPNIMTKRGQLDNIVTYEHYCDYTSDMENIAQEYITLGSICIVVHGSTGLQVYMADSNKEWTLISGNIASNEEIDDNPKIDDTQFSDIIQGG